MHPCICPTRSYQLYFFAQQNGQGIFQNFLHRYGVWLTLPTMIGFTEIRKLNEISQKDSLILQSVKICIVLLY
jgi:hypothetical protein